MAGKVAKLHYKNLWDKTVQINSYWFVTLSLKEGALVLWKRRLPDPVNLGLILDVDGDDEGNIELLVNKETGIPFKRYLMKLRFMEKNASQLALGQGIMTAPPDQIGRYLATKIDRSPNKRQLEREIIKVAIKTGLFGVLLHPTKSYWSYPELANPPPPAPVDERRQGKTVSQPTFGTVTKSALPPRQKASTQVPRVVAEEDEEDDEDIEEDIRQSREHNQAQWAAAKTSSGSKDKGKGLASAAEQVPLPPKQPREKLLGQSFNVSSAQAAREVGKKERERPRETPVAPTPVAQSEEASTTPSMDPMEALSQTQKTKQKRSSAKLKTLKQMDSSKIDKEKSEIRRRIVERCHVSAQPIVIPLEQLAEPTLEQDPSCWGPYQIRALSEGFVDQLTSSMKMNTDSNYHPLVVVLQPRFWNKGTKEDWRDDFPTDWIFDYVGGNHSLLARYRITRAHPGDYNQLHYDNCIVYIGLTKSEAALIAHDDNADALIRRKYTFPQMVQYFHKKYLERGDESTKDLRRRLTIETQVISPVQTVESKMLTLEGTFQVVFRTGPLWDAQQQLFRKFEKKETVGKKSGKKADTGDSQINMTFFKPLQGVSDDKKLSILLRVLDGNLTLDKVKQECEASRVLDIMSAAFCKQVGVSSWEEAKEKLPEYAAEKRINQYHDIFKDLLKDRSKRAFLNKYCNLEGDDDADETSEAKKPRGLKKKRARGSPLGFSGFL